MADGISFDFSEILKLSADLSEAPRKAAPNIRKAIEVTSRYIRDDWRRDASGSSLAPGGDRSISYDITGGAGIRGGVIESEIGPTLGGAGSLVGLLEYGTPTTGPRGYGAAALQKNQQDFEDGLAKAVEDVL